MASMTVAIHQPNYLPYPGFFDKWDRADLFVFLDHVPYSRSGWQNRNLIHTPNGPQRLSIPVAHRGASGSIRETPVMDRPAWRRKHRTAIEHNYAHAPHLDVSRPVLEQTYDPALHTIGAVNITCCSALARLLGIATPAITSSSLGVFTQTKTDLLIEICRRVGADTYLTGDGAATYLNTTAFTDAGLGLRWQHYTPPNYPRPHHAAQAQVAVSVLDLIVNTGTGALPRIRRARPQPDRVHS
jgi:hypothetical protein